MLSGKPIPLSLRLALLVAGTALPLILFASWIVYQNYITDRDAATARALQVARSIRLVVDRELQGYISALQVLAIARSLQEADIARFRLQAESYLNQFPNGGIISLADQTGRQIMNTNVPLGAPMAARANMDSLRTVFSTNRFYVSNLFTGNVSNRPLVTVSVPVLVGNRIAYDLAFAPRIENFQAIIDEQRPTKDWVIAIFDGTGTNLARVPGGERLYQKASPTLLGPLLAKTEGTLLTYSLEGAPVFTAFTRSQLSGWSVAVGAPTHVIAGTFWRYLFLIVAAGMACIALGLAFSISMARRIVRGEKLHELLINELNHRVKNTLATVQSIATQSFRDAPDIAEARRKFEARLVSLGEAHNVLSKDRWESAELSDIVDGVLSPHAAKDGERICVSGPVVRLSPRCALMMSMVLHELTTNAAKYGALSNRSGRVLVDWAYGGEAGTDTLRLHWRESGGPPVGRVERRGFGSMLIERGFPAQLGGKAKIDYNVDGVLCTLECPIV